MNENFEQENTEINENLQRENDSMTNKSNNVKSTKNDLRDIIRFTLIALLIVIPVRMYIAQPFIVSGESMVPTLQNGEYLIIDEISYRFEKPERGDVIVFKFPNDTSRFFIKRIIGLPGEKVSVRHGSVKITDTEGAITELDEDYIKESFVGNTTKTLADGEYFVMGDNRRASSDSRSWGTLEEKYIIGKTFIRIFPLSKIELYPGTVSIDEPKEDEVINNN